jgi:hypothetical protein
MEKNYVGSQDRIIQRHWQQDTGRNKQTNNTYNTTKKTKGSQDRIIQDETWRKIKWAVKIG